MGSAGNKGRQKLASRNQKLTWNQTKMEAIFGYI